MLILPDPPSGVGDTEQRLRRLERFAAELTEALGWQLDIMTVPDNAVTADNKKGVS